MQKLVCYNIRSKNAERPWHQWTMLVSYAFKFLFLYDLNFIDLTKLKVD